MLDRPIVAFDIETIPDPEVGRRVLGIEGDDRAVVHEMVRRRKDETQGQSEYPQLPWQRVVCICATVLDVAKGHAEVRHLGGEMLDEKSHLEGFFRLVTSELGSPRLASWNGGSFDLPVIRYRSLVHGVAAPGFYRSDADRRWNNYQNRYHDLHVDVMDVLSSYGGAMRAGLGTMSALLGIPSKSFLDRAIYDHVLDGDAEHLVEYCKLDTVDTMLLFLAWAHHVGHATREQVVRGTDAIVAAIGRLPFEGWREIERALAGWPAWARPQPSRNPAATPNRLASGV